MSLSKVFTFRTNASRAARKMGIKNAPLIPVAGGYQFEIPAEVAPGVVAHSPYPAPMPNVEIVTLPAPEPLGGKRAVILADIPIEPRMPRLARREREAEPAPAATATVPVEPIAPAEPKPRRRTKKEREDAACEEMRREATQAAKQTGKRQRGAGDRLVGIVRLGWTPMARLCDLMGWQAHSLRAELSRQARSRGLTVERRSNGGATEYRMKAA